MKFRLTAVLLFAFGLYAQQTGPPGTFMVTADPSGACSIGSALQYNVNNGNLWGCKNGTWTQISGGGGGGAVSAVFGRTGNVTATTGDYTAAKVTNAVDSTSTYSNPSWITALASSKITGLTIFATLAAGASSTYVRGDGTTQTLNCSAIAGSSAFCSSTDAANLTGTINNARLPSAISIPGPVTLTGSGAGAIDMATGVAPSNPPAGQFTFFFNSANSDHASVLNHAGIVTDLQAAPVITGGTCTNQAVTAVNTSGVPTCTTLTSAYVDTTIAKTGTDVNTSNQVTQTHLAAALPVNQGGTGTTGTLVGLMRGSSSAMTAAELSGDCTTSGSNAVVCTKSNGVSLSAFATATGSINAQTATYQVLAADFTNLKTITVASGTFTITLVASGSQPASGLYVRVLNYGSGVVTIARSGQNINGGTASLTLAAASATAPTGARIGSDGTDYYAQTFGGSGGTTVTFSAPYGSFGGNSYDWTQDTVPSGSWTWVNQGTSTVSTTAGGAVHVVYQGNGTEQFRGYMQPTPGATYTLIIHCRQNSNGACGIGLYDGTKARTVFWAQNNAAKNQQLCLYTYTTVTSPSAGQCSAASSIPQPDMWMKVVEDGTHRTWYTSTFDGDYQSILQESTNAGLTPTFMGLGADTFTYLAGNPSEDSLLLSFKLTTP